MSILLSIKPKWAEKIFSNEKISELRKKIWKRDDIKKVYVYASSPIRKIVGYFYINKIQCFAIHNLWIATQETAGLTKEEFETYFSGASYGYSISIKKSILLRKQIDPKIIDPNFKAPQNFKYINRDFKWKLYEAIQNQFPQYQLIEYPQCSICEVSEQYSDGTFKCMYEDPEESEPTPHCDAFGDENRFSPIYLSGVIEFLLNEIKELKGRIKELEKKEV